MKVTSGFYPRLMVTEETLDQQRRQLELDMALQDMQRKAEMEVVREAAWRRRKAALLQAAVLVSAFLGAMAGTLLR